MINKNKNIRIVITLPIKQEEWLRNTCKKAMITPSQYISWILSKKAEEMIKILKYQLDDYTDEEIADLIQCIKTPWIN